MGGGLVAIFWNPFYAICRTHRCYLVRDRRGNYVLHLGIKRLRGSQKFRISGDRNKGGRTDVSHTASRSIIVLGQEQLDRSEETRCWVVSDLGDGDHRIPKNPAKETPLNPILRNPATVVYLGE